MLAVVLCSRVRRPSAPAAAQGTEGASGSAFYVDGELYRTVGTPTDLSGIGAPAHSYDTIYEFFGSQPNVATAAPGHKGYNGGRWRVQQFPIGLRSRGRVCRLERKRGHRQRRGARRRFAAGTAVVSGSGPSFVCPVIKLPHS